MASFWWATLKPLFGLPPIFGHHQDPFPVFPWIGRLQVRPGPGADSPPTRPSKASHPLLCQLQAPPHAPFKPSPYPLQAPSHSPFAWLLQRLLAGATHAREQAQQAREQAAASLKAGAGAGQEGQLERMRGLIEVRTVAAVGRGDWHGGMSSPT